MRNDPLLLHQPREANPRLAYRLRGVAAGGGMFIRFPDDSFFFINTVQDGRVYFFTLWIYAEVSLAEWRKQILKLHMQGWGI